MTADESDIENWLCREREIRGSSHPTFQRRRDEGEPFDCPNPITCQFPRCDCDAPSIKTAKEN